MNRTTSIMNRITHAVFSLRHHFMARTRRQRMESFRKLLGITGGERIIDLGGASAFWSDLDVPVSLTIVNLPGQTGALSIDTIHKVRLHEGDACNLPEFPDQSFDITFSNSVIEHVGNGDQRRRFAGEVKRLAPRHWVQTPAMWYPIEAHTYMLFWWFYPDSFRKWFIARWRARLPDWTTMIENTTVLDRAELNSLFPSSSTWNERHLGIIKSYVYYKNT